jgi:hypothetical protein
VALQNLSELDALTFTKVKDARRSANSGHAPVVSPVKSIWEKIMDVGKAVDASIRIPSLDGL